MLIGRKRERGTLKVLFLFVAFSLLIRFWFRRIHSQLSFFLSSLTCLCFWNTYCFASYYIHCLRGSYKIAASVHRSFVLLLLIIAKDFVTFDHYALNWPILINVITSFENKKENLSFLFVSD